MSYNSKGERVDDRLTNVDYSSPFVVATAELNPYKKVVEFPAGRSNGRSVALAVNGRPTAAADDIPSMAVSLSIYRKLRGSQTVYMFIFIVSEAGNSVWKPLFLALLPPCVLPVRRRHYSI